MATENTIPVIEKSEDTKPVKIPKPKDPVKKITCECGSVISEKNVTAHLSTKKHLNSIKKETKVEVEPVVQPIKKLVEFDVEEERDLTPDEKLDEIMDSISYLTEVVCLIAEVLNVELPDDGDEEIESH